MDVAAVRQAIYELLESSSNPVLDQTLRMAEKSGWDKVVANADPATTAQLLQLLVAAYKQQQQVTSLVAETYEDLLAALAQQCQRELDAMDVEMSAEIDAAYATRKTNWLAVLLTGLGGYVVGRHGSSK